MCLSKEDVGEKRVRRRKKVSDLANEVISSIFPRVERRYFPKDFLLSEMDLQHINQSVSQLFDQRNINFANQSIDMSEK